MPFPNTTGKHAYEPLFSPKEALAYQKHSPQWRDFVVPPSVLICYQDALLQHILGSEAVERIRLGFGHLYLLQRTANQVGVRAGFGIGSPMAAMVLELLIELGTRQFVNLGVAGGIHPTLRIGDVVVCNRAVRDEGVSHHYLPPEKYVDASPALTARLQAALSQHAVAPVTGSTWTIDAPFRETVQELSQYRAEGVLTVEMEAAALFAVAQVRQVEIASAFVISDLLGETWEPQFRASDVTRNLVHLYTIAIEVLQEQPQ
jgi:uridine phosphorylase